MDELTHLEQAVLRALLTGAHPVLAALRAQLRAVRVARRQATAAAFSTWLEVGRQVRLAAVGPRRLILDDVHADIPALAHGASFALFVVDGRLERLEGVTFGGEEWPDDVAGFTLHYDDEPERDLSDLD